MNKEQFHSETKKSDHSGQIYLISIGCLNAIARLNKNFNANDYEILLLEINNIAVFNLKNKIQITGQAIEDLNKCIHNFWFDYRKHLHQIERKYFTIIKETNESKIPTFPDNIQDIVIKSNEICSYVYIKKWRSNAYRNFAKILSGCYKILNKYDKMINCDKAIIISYNNSIQNIENNNKRQNKTKKTTILQNVSSFEISTQNSESRIELNLSNIESAIFRLNSQYNNVDYEYLLWAYNENNKSNGENNTQILSSQQADALLICLGKYSIDYWNSAINELYDMSVFADQNLDSDIPADKEKTNSMLAKCIKVCQFEYIKSKLPTLIYEYKFLIRAFYSLLNQTENFKKCNQEIIESYKNEINQLNEKLKSYEPANTHRESTVPSNIDSQTHATAFTSAATTATTAPAVSVITTVGLNPMSNELTFDSINITLADINTAISNLQVNFNTNDYCYLLYALNEYELLNDKKTRSNIVKNLKNYSSSYFRPLIGAIFQNVNYGYYLRYLDSPTEESQRYYNQYIDSTHYSNNPYQNCPLHDSDLDLNELVEEGKKYCQLLIKFEFVRQHEPKYYSLFNFYLGLFYILSKDDANALLYLNNAKPNAGDNLAEIEKLLNQVRENLNNTSNNSQEISPQYSATSPSHHANVQERASTRKRNHQAAFGQQTDDDFSYRETSQRRGSPIIFQTGIIEESRGEMQEKTPTLTNNSMSHQ